MSKTKGITIWEQNVEYFVLAVAGLTACVFIALQFIGQPNAVERAPHGVIGPGQVDGVLQSEAARVNALLNAPAEDLERRAPQMLAAFEDGLRRSLSPSPTIGALAAHVPLQFGEGRAGVEVVYVEPEIPAPTRIIARQYHDTITEEAVSENGLQEIVSGPPHDVTWVTVAGTHDGEEQLRRFHAAGPDGNPAPIPSIWHHDRPIVMNVVAERETYRDGTWGSLVTLDPIPGQTHLREDLVQDVDSSRRDSLLRRARDSFVQEELLRPAFYPTKGGSVMPPDPYEDGMREDDTQSRARMLVRQRDHWKSRRDELARRIEDLEGRGSGPTQGPRGSGGGGGMSPGGMSPGGASSGGGMSPGGMSPGGTTPGGSQRDRDRDRGAPPERSLDFLKARLAEIERSIETLDREIEALIPASEAERLAGMPSGDIVFWIHDLTAEVGQTYRYRFVVEVFNPFCARKLNLVEEQHHLADTYVLRSEPGDWSEPVSIEPPIRMFITRAEPPPPRQPQGLIGQATGNAGVEIWRFHDGGWHQHTMSLTPGERVGEVRVDRTGEGPAVDFGTEWFVLDIIPIPDASPPRNGRVILQNLRTGEIEERRAQWDAPALERLNRQVRQLAGSLRI